MYFLVSIFIQLIFINIIDDAVTLHDGEWVEEGNFKFLAYIPVIMDNEYYLCGGVVIDEFHVITAAHCVACPKLSEISVFVGSASEIVSTATSYRPIEVYVHPNYSSAEDSSINFSCLDYLKYYLSSTPLSKHRKTPANDIAIVKVQRRITLADDFTNVKLPVSESLPYCEVLPFAGWYTPISTWSATLQSTQVVLIRKEDCNVQLSSDHYCAVTLDGGKRIQPGDSGLALVHNNILYGIMKGSANTETGMPFVFTKIFDHIDFITEKYVSEVSTVRDCVENCVEKEVWSTRTYCCQNDGCNKAGPRLHAAITTLWMTSIALGIVAAGRLGG